jgi:HNH endonuclease
MPPRVGRVLRICEICGGSFRVRQAEINRGGGICCSRLCGGRYSRTHRKPLKMNVVCALCKKPFHKGTSKIQNSKSGLVFCCRSHKDEAQRIGGIPAIMPPHYGTAVGGHASTYRKLRLRLGGLKLCGRCGYSKIPEILVVHHKDRNRANNKPSNLEDLCPNCHQEEHFLASDGLWSRKN